MVKLQQKAPPPDGGWGWIVMIASFLNTTAMFGVLKSGGVLYVAIINELHVSRTQAALVPSLAFSLSCLLGPVASSLCSHFSHRSVIFVGAFLSGFGVTMAAIFPTLLVMTIFYGGVMGIGCGLMMIPNFAILYEYFFRHRSLATGVSLAGGSIGFFILPPLLEWVKETYGLVECLLTISAIMLQTCPIALLMRPLKASSSSFQKKYELKPVVTKELQAKSRQGNGKEGVVSAENGEFDPLMKEKTKSAVETSNATTVKTTNRKSALRRIMSIAAVDPSTFRERHFYLVSFTMLCFTYSWLAYQTILPDYVTTEAAEPISTRNAVFLFSILSVGDLVFRVFSGWLMDQKWVNRPCAYLFFLLSAGTLMILHFPSHNYTGFIVITAILGIFVSGNIILPPILFVDLLGASRFPMAFGVSSAANGFVVFLAGPSAAYIRDVYGSYKPCIALLSATIYFAAFVWSVDLIWTRCKRPSQPVQDNVS